MTMAALPHVPAIRAAAERIASRVGNGGDPAHAYTRDLALEGVLHLAVLTGDRRWYEVVEAAVSQRGWTAGVRAPWRSEPFCSLSWAWITATSSAAGRSAFCAEAEDMCRTLERTADGLVTHPRGASRGGGVAVLLDSFQEYASRVARAGAWLGNVELFADVAEQATKHRDLLRDPVSGLWCQGRGWIADRPHQLSPGTWSRGQGWLLRGLVAAVQAIPTTAPAHATVKAIFVQAAEAVRACQQTSGMWHALPHRPASDSVAESSGTGLIAAALLDGIRSGIVPIEGYRECAMRAVAALVPRVDGAGVVHDACPGPGPLQEEAPWLVPHFPPGDPHGAGCVLAALTAALR